jgi:hypothetical protein
MHASRFPRCISCMHGESRIEYSVSHIFHDFFVRGSTRINCTPVIFTGTGTAEFTGFRVHVYQFAAQSGGVHDVAKTRGRAWSLSNLSTEVTERTLYYTVGTATLQYVESCARISPHAGQWQQPMQLPTGLFLLHSSRHITPYILVRQCAIRAHGRGQRTRVDGVCI